MASIELLTVAEVSKLLKCNVADIMTFIDDQDV